MNIIKRNGSEAVFEKAKILALAFTAWQLKSWRKTWQIAALFCEKSNLAVVFRAQK